MLDDLRGKAGNMNARQVDAALRRQLGHLGLVRDPSLGLPWPKCQCNMVLGRARQVGGPPRSGEAHVQAPLLFAYSLPVSSFTQHKSLTQPGAYTGI